VTLSIMTSTLASGAVEISPSGEIDVENAYTVKDAVADQLADNRPERIELNMQDVTFIDSVGISLLLTTRERLKELGGSISVTNASGMTLRTLQTSGVYDVLTKGT